jgi:hypothetical protein
MIVRFDRRSRFLILLLVLAETKAVERLIKY